MEYLTFNFDTTKVREEVLHGEIYWVAPIAMMVECVANGSQGPLFYSGDELRKWSPAWNHKPMVLDHPLDGSACTREFLNERQLGVVLNTQWDGKQRSEGWFNQKMTQKTSPMVANALRRGEMLEVSTGLYVDRVETSGDYHGKHYDGLAINHRPDHLAILTKGEGACSIKDGAGLLQLNRNFSADERKKLAKSGKAMPDGSFPIQNEEDLKNAIHLAGRASNPAAARAHIRRRAKALGLSKLIPSSWGSTNNHDEMVLNDLSHDELRCQLNSELMEMYGQQMEDTPSVGEPWVRAVFDDYLIYWWGGKTFQIGYQKSEDDEVTLVGDPTEVEQKVSYQPVDNSSGIISQEDCPMTKKELIDKIIKNTERTGLEEADRKYLEGLDEKKLEKMAKNCEAPAAPQFTFNSQAELDAAVKTKVDEELAKNNKKNDPPPAPTTERPPLSPAEWLAAMPPEARAVHNNMAKAYQTELTNLVTIITANASNTIPKESLLKMDIDLLRNMAALARPADAAANPMQQLMGNFFGLAPLPALNAAGEEESLALPVYNQDRLAGKTPASTAAA